MQSYNNISDFANIVCKFCFVCIMYRGKIVFAATTNFIPCNLLPCISQQASFFFRKKWDLLGTHLGLTWEENTIATYGVEVVVEANATLDKSMKNALVAYYYRMR